jgi:hypothetical protein
VIRNFNADGFGSLYPKYCAAQTVSDRASGAHVQLPAGSQSGSTSRLVRPARSRGWPADVRSLRLLAGLVQPQPTAGALRQVVPQRGTGDVPDDGRDLPGQTLVYRCLLGRRPQRNPDAAARENVVPGGGEPGTAAQGAQPPDSWLGCPDLHGPADRTVPGQS